MVNALSLGWQITESETQDIPCKKVGDHWIGTMHVSIDNTDVL